MNWKEFLKPTKRKITITLIIVLIFTFFNLGISCTGGKFCTEGKTSYHPPLTCNFYSECIDKADAINLNIIHNIINYSIVITLSYLVSALISSRN